MDLLFDSSYCTGYNNRISARVNLKLNVKQYADYLETISKIQDAKSFEGKKSEETCKKLYCHYKNFMKIENDCDINTELISSICSKQSSLRTFKLDGMGNSQTKKYLIDFKTITGLKWINICKGNPTSFVKEFDNDVFVEVESELNDESDNILREKIGELVKFEPLPFNLEEANSLIEECKKINFKYMYSTDESVQAYNKDVKEAKDLYEIGVRKMEFYKDKVKSGKYLENKKESESIMEGSFLRYGSGKPFEEMVKYTGVEEEFKSFESRLKEFEKKSTKTFVLDDTHAKILSESVIKKITGFKGNSAINVVLDKVDEITKLRNVRKKKRGKQSPKKKRFRFLKKKLNKFYQTVFIACKYLVTNKKRTGKFKENRESEYDRQASHLAINSVRRYLKEILDPKIFSEISGSTKKRIMKQRYDDKIYRIYLNPNY